MLRYVQKNWKSPGHAFGGLATTAEHVQVPGLEMTGSQEESIARNGGGLMETET